MLTFAKQKRTLFGRCNAMLVCMALAVMASIVAIIVVGSVIAARSAHRRREAYHRAAQQARMNRRKYEHPRWMQLKPPEGEPPITSTARVRTAGDRAAWR
ncbi:MAG: hypothetical protein JO199_08290 [Candidatus Eremiobacteraeota bacterium]|nr:hypothetical protein [Candidatus Eremiobacteraeota bacterium]